MGEKRASALTVAHFTEATGWTGGSGRLLELAAGLDALGAKNWIVCPPGQLQDKAREKGLAVFSLPFHKEYDIFAARKLAKWLEEAGVSLVHAHHSRAHGVALLAKAFFSKRPFTLVVSRRVSHPIGNNPLSALKYTNKLVNCYVAVAEAVKDILVKAGVEAARVEVIHSGLDPDRFTPRPASEALRRELGLPSGRKILGKIGNASASKAQDVFLKAVKRLLDSGRDVHALLAGRDTQGEWIAGLIKELGLEGRVSAAGFREDVPDLLACMDLSVNTAVAGEGLSGAMRESLAMGVPVAASDLAGNRELVQEGKTGLLFPPGDDAALAKRMEWILDHPAEAKAQAEAGRALVRERFGVARHIARHHELYRRLSPS